MEYNTGMMSQNRDSETTALNKLRKAIEQPKPQLLTDAKSINDAIEALSPEQRQSLEFQIKLQNMAMRAIRKYQPSYSYEELVKSTVKFDAKFRNLLVAALENLDPTPDTPIKPKPKKKYDPLNLYNKPEFQPLPEAELAAMLGKKSQPTPQAKSSFREQLEQSESSGQSDAEIELDDGRKYIGLMQMGEARLEDYKKATNTSFTQEEFKNNPQLQDKVGDWHLADIDKNIDAMGDESKSYNRDGLRAVAHIGGIGGMKKYVRSKGQYNPSDQLGTSLNDYYSKFSGEV